MKSTPMIAALAALGFACAGGSKAPSQTATNVEEKTATVSPVSSKPAPSPKVEPTPVPTVVSVSKIDSPTVVIQKYTEELRSVVEIKDPTLRGKKNQQREQSISGKVRNFFDFNELAKQSLGANWAKRTPAEREKFSRLFIALVERSYLSRSRQLVSDYKVNYTNESIHDGLANVTCRVAQKDASVDITYDLHNRSGKWMIYNITLDNVNLIRNYQSQFNQIIQQKGFRHLLSTMEKKLNSDDKDAAAL